MTLAGARFTEEDAKWVVAALLLKRDEESLTAAAAIQVALESGAEEAGLTDRGDAAVAAVLEEAWRGRVIDEAHLLVDGVVISGGDARVLIDLLTQSGTKESLFAARAIEYARAEKHLRVDLSDTCRRAIFRVPPTRRPSSSASYAVPSPGHSCSQPTPELAKFLALSTGKPVNQEPVRPRWGLS